MAIDGYTIHLETQVAASNSAGNTITVKLAQQPPTFYIGMTQLYFPESGIAATISSHNPTTGEFTFTSTYIPQVGEPVVVRTPNDLLQSAVASGLQGARLVLQVADSAGTVHNIPVVLA